ncbi:hypothetical protein [uncultured Aureimonas sp.]|uniref:hypothetical protein n=1 Tax=uncultured Aureimonas sp. TaxID=1604662 RepID=UPI0025E571DB|nr:hypothetical protein [uncultured Aureimonas sp.]
MAEPSTPPQLVARLQREDALRRLKIRWALRFVVGILLVAPWATEIRPSAPDDPQAFRFFFYALFAFAAVLAWLVESLIIRYLITPLEHWRKNRVTIRRIRVPVPLPTETLVTGRNRRTIEDVRDEQH